MENMDSRDQQTFLSNIQLSMITEEPRKNAITCFDVNSDGLIAIGSEDLMNKGVAIYKPDGTFQYGYVFKCSGSFGIEWDNSNLIICFVRSDVAASFDANGTNIEMKKIQDTVDNNSYWNHSVFSTRRTVDSNQYILSNNMGLFNIFASSYAELTKTDLSRRTTILYDASNTCFTTKNIIVCIAIFLFVIIVISLVVMQFLTLKKSKNCLKL